MNAEQFLNEALGGNMNISTLKPLAWHEIMEQYARHKIMEAQAASTNNRVMPCAHWVPGGICSVFTDNRCGKNRSCLISAQA